LSTRQATLERHWPVHGDLRLAVDQRPLIQAETPTMPLSLVRQYGPRRVSTATRSRLPDQTIWPWRTVHRWRLLNRSPYQRGSFQQWLTTTCAQSYIKPI